MITKRIIEERLMEIINKNIDDGTPFDWGRTSSDYAKYRDIYPEHHQITQNIVIYIHSSFMTK